jgi:hypothetical protein
MLSKTLRALIFASIDFLKPSTVVLSPERCGGPFLFDREQQSSPPSTSAGGGSSAASERNSRGSPAASFSMGMTMATPVIAFGSLQRPRPARQVVRTVDVGETFQHGGNDPPLQEERGAPSEGEQG